MSPDSLRKRVMEEFQSTGLLQCLDLESSAFRELPRFFEASHLSMRLVLQDAAALAAVSGTAAQIRRDLERQGIALDYLIRVQWKVMDIYSDTLEELGTPTCTPERLHAVLHSGTASRCVSIQISPAAYDCILKYVSDVATADRPGAIYKLLQACVTRKLSTEAEEYWDPVLYPTRTVDEHDIARIISSADKVQETALTARV